MHPVIYSLVCSLSTGGPNLANDADAPTDAVALDTAEPDARADEPASDTGTIEVVRLEERVAAAGVGAPAPASNIKGRIRIHIDGNVFSFRHNVEWFEDDHMPEDEVEDVTNSVGVGIGEHNFGIGVGYGITDGLIVGAKLGLGFSHSKDIDRNDMGLTPDGVSNGFRYAVRPYVEYAFIPGGRFRPFIFVQGGVAGTRSVITDVDETDKLTTHLLSPTIGGGGGLHMFIIPQLSIDIAADVNHYWTHARGRYEVDGVPDPDVDDEYNRLNQLTELSVLLGLSLWFGVGG